MIHLFSIILGLVALIAPIFNLLGYKKQKSKKWFAFSIISFSACAIAICLQIFYSYILVENGELASLMDTVGTIAYVSAILVSVPILLNVVTFVMYRDKIAK
ncbi:hypothetical protein [Lysinibacillus xylanilyticus]|uniref:hypothetical protein n=1 Tax=Lysinibacillus xylanilyticus TaxID=582475 RepID=UPI003D99D212